MNRSRIEYLISANGSPGYTLNLVTGCLHQEQGVCRAGKDFTCWAEAITKRFPERFPNGFVPTLYKNEVYAALRPSALPQDQICRVGVCFMGDLFGDWNNPNQLIKMWFDPSQPTYLSLSDLLLKVVRRHPQHHFLFLTKAPWNLQKWAPFPPNAWVGASVCDAKSAELAQAGLMGLDAETWGHLRWLSIEPLLEEIDPNIVQGMDWVVIGGVGGRGKAHQPKREWIERIAAECIKRHIPVWLKNNLKGVMGNETLRQEFPLVYKGE